MKRDLAPVAGPPEAMATAATPPAPLLSLAGASVRFGAVTALQGVDLALHRGDRLALVGANGCGKTTLLRLLHGLVPLAAGARRVGVAPHGRPMRMAMLFQRPFLLNLSAQRNVRLGLWLAGVPGPERAARAARALQRVGLEAQATRVATTLSGGQQQRLALARAWALEPDVLLLDEPTASLDPGAKREVEQLIDELAAEGMTVVMSSHNLGQVKRLATRVVYLDEGRVLVDTGVSRFFEGPLPPAAAHFLKGELGWR